MKAKTCTIALIIALIAVAAPSLASANGGQRHKSAKKPAKVKRYVHFGGVAAWRSATEIGEALKVHVATEGPRAGYCAPVPMPRVGEPDGIYLNLYAGEENAAFYLTLGIVPARIDPIAGSTC